MIKSVTIEYKNKTLKSSQWRYLSDEECNKVINAYYEKPPIQSVITNLKNLHNGGKVVSYIKRYFFKALMAKCTLSHSKWSVEEILGCNDLIRHFYGVTIKNSKVYPESISKNIETAFRIGGKGIAVVPTNFPIKTINDILETYNTNNNYYDFSCGWGIRLLASLTHKINYYGTDPNYLLTEQLNNLARLYKKVNNSKTITDIRYSGSQILIPDWIGQIGLAFSSPPYFNLEDYKIGNQSYTLNTAYSEWLKNYVYPTIKNIYKYLIPGGYLLINIKNLKNYPLYDDFYSYIENTKCFHTLNSIELKNITRYHGSKNIAQKGIVNNTENIMVFRKNNQSKYYKKLNDKINSMGNSLSKIENLLNKNKLKKIELIKRIDELEKDLNLLESIT